MQKLDSSCDSSSDDSSDESMSDGLAELVEIKSDSEGVRTCSRNRKKDEYEWIPRTELDKMSQSGRTTTANGTTNCTTNGNTVNVNQITEKKNSEIQLEQDNSKN